MAMMQEIIRSMGHQNVKVRSKEAMALSKNRINCIFQKNHLMDKETVFNNLKTVLHSSDMPKDKQDEAIAKMLKDLNLEGLENVKVNACPVRKTACGDCPSAS